MSTNVRVKKNKYGRGVYAARNFRKGEKIETSPVVVVKDADIRDRDRLSHYAFEWSRGCSAIALGMGSLFNHSEDPNAYWEVSKKGHTLRFFAQRAIRSGEEICTNYGYDPTERPQKPIACDLKKE